MGYGKISDYNMAGVIKLSHILLWCGESIFDHIFVGGFLLFLWNNIIPVLLRFRASVWYQSVSNICWQLITGFLFVILIYIWMLSLRSLFTSGGYKYEDDAECRFFDNQFNVVFWKQLLSHLDFPGFCDPVILRYEFMQTHICMHANLHAYFF